jgi:hypothetical protein
MTMIREAIKERMKELNLKPCHLYEMLKNEIPRQTIYDFLTEKDNNNNWRDTRTEVASAMMKALGLEVKPKKKRGKLIGFEVGRKTTKVVIGKKKKLRAEK